MENIINTEYLETPYGELIIGSYEDKLCLCDWRYRKMRASIDIRIKTGLNAEFIYQTSSVIENTISQLTEYFRGERTEFDIPLHFVGSDFQKQVWNALVQIPYGKTMTYMELSKQINNAKAIRAVGAANGANAISIIIPCHRIVGSDGDLVGYAGGLKTKMKLLQLEKALINDQISMFNFH